MQFLGDNMRFTAIYFLFLCAVFFCIKASAQPVIAGASSGSMTITGSGFGDFGGEVITWDDFERHAAGAKINLLQPVVGTPWQSLYSYAGQGIVIDQARSISGTNAVKVDWAIDPYSIRAFGWYNRPPITQAYITYWRWQEGTFAASTSNHKQFYLTGNNAGFPQVMSLIIGGTDQWGVYNQVGDGAVSWTQRNNPNTKGWVWGNTNSRFQRWEYWFKLNSPSTASNGVVQVWLDNVLGINTSTYRIGYVDGQFKDFSLGHMAQGFFSTAKAWFDDIYIATTLARVELCNAETYALCTKKHIQYVPANAWSDTTITLNLRGNALGEQWWLFVIDKNGLVSNGLPVTAQ